MLNWSPKCDVFDFMFYSCLGEPNSFRSTEPRVAFKERPSSMLFFKLQYSTLKILKVTKQGCAPRKCLIVSWKSQLLWPHNEYSALLYDTSWSLSPKWCLWANQKHGIADPYSVCDELFGQIHSKYFSLADMSTLVSSWPLSTKFKSTGSQRFFLIRQGENILLLCEILFRTFYAGFVKLLKDTTRAGWNKAQMRGTTKRIRQGKKMQRRESTTISDPWMDRLFMDSNKCFYEIISR